MQWLRARLARQLEVSILAGFNTSAYFEVVVGVLAKVFRDKTQCPLARKSRTLRLKEFALIAIKSVLGTRVGMDWHCRMLFLDPRDIHEGNVLVPLGKMQNNWNPCTLGSMRYDMRPIITDGAFKSLESGRA